MLTIYLLRHAQTDYNVHMRFIGGRSNHLALSVEGRRQALRRSADFRERGVRFDRIFCSSAVRARETLELIMQHADITDAEVGWYDALNELSQGDWEGELRERIYTPEQLAEIEALTPFFKAPNGESQEEVGERMLRFLEQEVLAHYDRGCFLIVGHGVAFKCLLQKILHFDPKITWRLGCDNVSLTCLRYDPVQGWWLDYMNRI